MEDTPPEAAEPPVPPDPDPPATPHFAAVAAAVGKAGSASSGSRAESGTAARDGKRRRSASSASVQLVGSLTESQRAAALPGSLSALGTYDQIPNDEYDSRPTYQHREAEWALWHAGEYWVIGRPQDLADGHVGAAGFERAG